ncbi:class I SAM-dependent methyltransferase [Pedobacter sp. KR3-3]|uniref:Class I SAM-dependent methyltransferase n=1 Tax=Pedobacter albus TaxID=3113905 RepID=A0ABU7IBK1_9SPHI|nr:class I SAM-dependent methyltransferase [Pedobacter sp. KR3-3]MEE1946846.1 class I SAM-dependent methyltransferase [Pedobacter sp. KR3-3]
MKKFFLIGLRVIDIIFSPITLFVALWMRFIRLYQLRFWELNGLLTKRIFNLVGVFPIINHYYEPLFDARLLKHSLRKDRDLPGINFNIDAQLNLLEKFNFNHEILEIDSRPKNKLTFSFNRGAFLSGDAEYLFNMIRLFKPQRIIEVGCGSSTLMIQHAIEYNKKDSAGYDCKHICIEPYENDWLESLSVRVVRKVVEDVALEEFMELDENDILFIDSSHMIRPQGDVLFEFLNILPLLKKGVIVHIHDIFSPKDYLDEWLKKGVVFWNEQYLLEAFLSHNNAFEIIGALNLLKHRNYKELKTKCPMLLQDREPGSFWIRRI